MNPPLLYTVVVTFGTPETEGDDSYYIVAATDRGEAEERLREHFMDTESRALKMRVLDGVRHVHLEAVVPI